jgi:hypothetical protein
MTTPDADHVVDPLTRQIAEFISEIGLVLRWAPLIEPTQLPGIAIAAGELVVDLAGPRYPGDLLHEAGHLAVVPPSARAEVTGNAGADGGVEMSAIAWSYAAARRLGIDPAIVFHEAGYRGGSASLIANFDSGRYIGVPVLEWLGMTATGNNAERLGVPAYPHMLTWLLGEPPSS